MYDENPLALVRKGSLPVSGLGPSVLLFAMPVRHCQASDGFRGTSPIEPASSSSTDIEVTVGGSGGKKTTGPG